MEKRRTKTVAVLAAVAMLAAIIPLTANIAFAHSKRYGSRVSINGSGRRYSGRVTSRSKDCVKGRTVVLKKALRHRRDRTVGSDLVSRSGSWSIRHRRKGRYYAVVQRDVAGRYGHSHTCYRDRSRTV